MNPLLRALKAEIEFFCNDHMALALIDKLFSGAGFKIEENKERPNTRHGRYSGLVTGR